MKINSNILLIKNINRLEDLMNTVYLNVYRDIIKHSQSDEKLIKGMSEEEKYYKYTWQAISEIDSINLPCADGSKSFNDIRFQVATAKIEYPKRQKKGLDGKFLPKLDRLNLIEVEVLFFENGNKVYCLILSSNYYSVMRTKKLIGNDILDKVGEPYHIDSEVFNWLFYLFTEKSGIVSDWIQIENIDGFIGNVTDDANIFTGTSKQTSELIVTKAFISNGGLLRKISIRLKTEEVDVVYTIDENSNVLIDCRLSIILSLFENLKKERFLLLYLYGYLIVELNRLYQIKQSEFITMNNPLYSKKIGLEVIESIIKNNKIEISEVEKIFDATESIEVI